jgi:RNA polymerase sigma-70 factor (ECF subfamily)
MAHKPLLSIEREKQLLAMVQRGDRGALGELLGAYHKRVYHVCLRMVGHAEDAAELTQETMLRAMTHVDGFQANSKFSTWLLRIAMNLSISHLRRGKLRHTTSLDVPVDTSDQASTLKAMIASDREPSAHQSVELREQIDRMTAALGRIEPTLRSVILLRDLQGMDYQHIAEVLSVPVGTVKSRLFRARLALRQAMDGRSPRATRDNETDHDDDHGK